MAAQYPKGSNAALFSSGAGWISPNDKEGYQTDPPAADGRKVIINDTDHSFYYIALRKAGVAAQRAWVWKNLTRGNQVLFMDPYLDPTPWYVTDRNHPSGDTPDPYWDTLRSAMGDARLYADRMNLADMTPENALSSTHYCLANPGQEYLVYQPGTGAFTVDLQPGAYDYEWFNPADHTVVSKGSFTASAGSRSFTPPQQRRSRSLPERIEMMDRRTFLARDIPAAAIGLAAAWKSSFAATSTGDKPDDSPTLSFTTFICRTAPKRREWRSGWKTGSCRFSKSTALAPWDSST